MQSFPLSAHGIRASRLILGCMSLGGGWNSDPISRADLEAGARAVDAALAAGITMFDHADIYTRGPTSIRAARPRPSLARSCASALGSANGSSSNLNAGSASPMTPDRVVLTSRGPISSLPLRAAYAGFKPTFSMCSCCIARIR